MRFCLKTKTTMKPYANKKWWIDSGIVRPVYVDADSLDDALEIYRQNVRDFFGIEISEDAMQSKEAMYSNVHVTGESLQVGYVITGKKLFGDDEGWTTQFVDLWVTAEIVRSPFEKEPDSKHYVVAREWAADCVGEQGVTILGVAHSFDEAKKIFADNISQERELAETNGWTVYTDNEACFDAGWDGYYNRDHVKLIIVEVG